MNEESKQAAHEICTLANKMRDCKNCPFHPDNIRQANKQKESK